jgi:hypothetical protein
VGEAQTQAGNLQQDGGKGVVRCERERVNIAATRRSETERYDRYQQILMNIILINLE